MFASQMIIRNPNGKNVSCPPVKFPTGTKREVAREKINTLNWKHRVFDTGKYFKLVTLTDNKESVG